jgi:hypothetical protein
MRKIGVKAFAGAALLAIGCSPTVAVEGTGGKAQSASSTATSTIASSGSMTTPSGECQVYRSQNGTAALGGFCLTTSPAINGAGQIDCAIFDFFQADASGCNCDLAKGRIPISSAHQSELPQATIERQTDTAAPVSCVCEIQQLSGADLQTCQTKQWTPFGPPSGFCNVGPKPPQKGNCTPSDLGLSLRGVGSPGQEESFVLLCGDAQCTPAPHSACLDDGVACATTDDCCAGSVCSVLTGKCAPCTPIGQPLDCTAAQGCCDCCAGCNTDTKVCIKPDCINHGPCANAGDCCSGYCGPGGTCLQ